MSRYTVSAYITAYEDERSLSQCVSSLLEQTYPIEKILIVDNSKNVSKLNYEGDQVIVHHYPENIGISGGMEIAMRWATTEEYDFLWTFDQDSQPDPDCLDNLINEYVALTKIGESVGIIAPLPIDSNTSIELPGSIFDTYRVVPSPFHKEETYKCDIAITSGSLMSVSVLREASPPDKNLFIDAVDWDQCMKIKGEGHEIFMTRKATMLHRFSDMKRIKLPLVAKPIFTNNYSPTRRYYICRNHTYILMRYADSFSICLVIFSRLIYLLKSSIKIFLFEDNRFDKICCGIVGTADGFLRRLGKKQYNRR